MGVRELATFGGGCFWCTEAIFEALDGVERVVSGYAGGRRPNPSYEQVCAGVTGHAEVIQVTFDPSVITYRDLLVFFFAFHDPTTPNQQGPDIGTQYRSIILCHDEQQVATARDVIRSLTAEGVFGAPIVTEVLPLTEFWPAEDDHQGYYRRHPERGYCAAMIAPKMAKLRARYRDRLRTPGAPLERPVSPGDPPATAAGRRTMTTEAGVAKGTAKSKALEWIKAAAWALVIWLTLSTFVVQAYFIPSPSMERTLMVGDVLFVNKFLFGAKLPLIDVRTPALREPRRGDIVVFMSPIEDSILVKRLIGVPGDTVEMRGGVLYRNAQRLDEPYAQSLEPTWQLDSASRQSMRVMQLPHYAGTTPDTYLPDVHDWGPLVVPGDSLWMMGDNRDHSRDSRFWGLVPRKNVRGMPILIYYSYDASSYRPLPFLSAIRWDRLFTVPR